MDGLEANVLDRIFCVKCEAVTHTTGLWTHVQRTFSASVVVVALVIRDRWRGERGALL